MEYLFPIGWSELEGIANRGDFDLKAHGAGSGKPIEVVEQDGTRYVPHVIEPAAGVGRSMLAFLADAYDEEDLGDGDIRTVLKLHPRLAPVKVAILPLVRKDGQPELAAEVQGLLKKRMQTEYDEGGSIGKRYRRQDEIGTPWCVTIDHQSLEDRTVTLRDRDSLAQERDRDRRAGRAAVGPPGRTVVVAEDRGGGLSGARRAVSAAAQRVRRRLYGPWRVVGFAELTGQHPRARSATGDHPAQRRGLVAGLGSRVEVRDGPHEAGDAGDRELEGGIGGGEAAGLFELTQAHRTTGIREHAQQLAGDAPVGVGTIGHRGACSLQRHNAVVHTAQDSARVPARRAQVLGQDVELCAVPGAKTRCVSRSARRRRACPPRPSRDGRGRARRGCAAPGRRRGRR